MPPARARISATGYNDGRFMNVKKEMTAVLEENIRAKITAELIRGQAAALHDLDIPETRCAELTADVERHNAAIRNAAQQLDFNDEPARFNALLAAHAQSRKTGR